MMLASVAQKVISLTYFAIVANTLKPELTGVYTTALAMTTIFVVFVDFGYTNVFIREAAKYKEKMQELFSNIIFAKIFFAISTYIALAITLEVVGYDLEFKKLVYLSGVTMLFDSFTLTVYGALRAAGNLAYEAYSLAGSQLLTMIFGLIFLWMGLPLIYLMLAFALASFVNTLYAMYVAHKKCNLAFIPVYNKQILKSIFLLALPFALAGIFGRIYSYIDVLLIKELAGDVEAGYYSTPSKISFAFQFIPLALIASLYPKFSEYFNSNKEKLALLFHDSIKFLLIIALPISVGIYLLAQDILLLVFSPEFIRSADSLKILVISLTFSFLSFPIGAFLNATGKQNAQTKITGIVLVLNVILNILLIPRFGAVGAAWAALIGNIALGALGYMLIPRIVDISHSKLFTTALPIVCSAAVMGLCVWTSSQFMHVVVSIAVGALSYTAMLFITRSLTKKEVQDLLALVRK